MSYNLNRLRKPQRPLVFNCTPEMPYSMENFLRYLEALGLPPRGQMREVHVRHDGEPGGPCPNCGCLVF